MTKQEIFDKAYLGVLRQGGLATAPSGGCFYSLDGKFCAAGQLMTPEQGDQLVGLGLNSAPFDRANRALHLLPTELVPFVEQLQVAHDTVLTLDSFAKKMKIIALENDLTVPEFTK